MIPQIFMRTHVKDWARRSRVKIEKAIEQICRAPRTFPQFEGEVRRCLARRFPFTVLYTIESDHILVVALMHCSRKPGYWRTRLSG